jgi:biopolymer transport protein ExbD
MAIQQQQEFNAKDLEPNMTPMIDVIFQLLIFLMVANDLSRKEIEDLKLPEAIHAEEDKGAQLEERRVIVNLLKGKDGQPPKLRVKGKEMNLNQFAQELRIVARQHTEPESPNASSIFVLIRADTGARWQDVQYVMQVCADPSIKVYKLQFATEDPNKGKK